MKKPQTLELYMDQLTTSANEAVIKGRKQGYKTIIIKQASPDSFQPTCPHCNACTPTSQKDKFYYSYSDTVTNQALDRELKNRGMSQQPATSHQ